MRRSASEIIRNLERRIARLESRRASNQRQSKMSYDRWMKRVDDEVGSLIMVSVHDLVDYDSYGLWEAGVSPKRAAKIIIRNDGTFEGML